MFRSTAEEMERCNNPNPVVTSLAPRSDGRPHSLLEMPPIAPPIGMEEGSCFNVCIIEIYIFV